MNIFYTSFYLATADFLDVRLCGVADYLFVPEQNEWPILASKGLGR